ncbi:5-(carboxyamino)imidazole ribonucleotide synthase [uncultured Corynebacterium sp.]|uniref:5-(carboxyamino)imidazole ribonucleotide synthase n=1 Tax=uncultured Corynebacterium sp. TaxID=159447 RepID=UPI00262DD4DB|nr:5-(carboxyamino)imidazole ribonucleotide synthase [uncultured Corynebacterium sp.]
MIASDTPENSTNSASDSAAARTAAQHPAHADGVPIVSVIGDGQLARMMQTEAIELGQSIRLLAGSPGASAAQVCADVVIGDYHVWEDVERAVAGAQAVTFDHEHVPTEFLNRLTEMGYSVQPQPSALLYAQDKLLMRQRLEELGAPVPAYAAIDSAQDAEAFFDRVDGAVCLKARRGGYDGHGVWFPKGREDLSTLVDELLAKDVPLMAERKVALVRELSAMCARTPSGEVKAWPVLESVQRDGICVEAICPAPGLSDELASAAEKLSVTIASELGVTGALAVELFETTDADGNPEIYVNELAMRPHNTGHWSQDGCETSQFEQHMRAVADMPLGSTRPTAPVTVMVNTLGGEEASDVPISQRFAEVWRRFPSVKIHWYGKDWRPGRKLGHVNLCGYDASEEGIAETRRIANLAAGYIVDGAWADGYTA